MEYYQNVGIGPLGDAHSANVGMKIGHGRFLPRALAG
jgi:hypothetical protein